MSSRPNPHVLPQQNFVSSTASYRSKAPQLANLHSRTEFSANQYGDHSNHQPSCWHRDTCEFCTFVQLRFLCSLPICLVRHVATNIGHKGIQKHMVHGLREPLSRKKRGTSYDTQYFVGCSHHVIKNRSHKDPSKVQRYWSELTNATPIP